MQFRLPHRRFFDGIRAIGRHQDHPLDLAGRCRGASITGPSSASDAYVREGPSGTSGSLC